MKGWRGWLVRWQVELGHLPAMMLVLAALWITVGAVDRDAIKDLLQPIAQLPIVCAYALAIISATYLAGRRMRRKLTDDEQRALHEAVIAGSFGAWLLVIIEGVKILCAFVLFWHLFSQALR